jgi:hypothetical protein
VAAVAAGLDACGALAGEAVWLAEGDAAMNATLSAATIFKSLTRIVSRLLSHSYVFISNWLEIPPELAR